MHAESQAYFLVLMSVYIAVFVHADRTAWGREITLLYSDFSGFSNAVSMACVFALIFIFRDEHYVLLMLATVALFSMACMGLNLQMAFGGVMNFAGAAFFVIGSYTAAVFSSYGLPSVLSLIASGLLAGCLGAALLLPVLRTRGHYAALVTIAFGLLFRTFMEVNDTFGGPQRMKIKGFSAMGFEFNRITSIGSMTVSFYFCYAVGSDTARAYVHSDPKNRAIMDRYRA